MRKTVKLISGACACMTILFIGFSVGATVMANKYDRIIKSATRELEDLYDNLVSG